MAALAHRGVPRGRRARTARRRTRLRPRPPAFRAAPARRRDRARRPRCLAGCPAHRGCARPGGTAARRCRQRRPRGLARPTRRGRRRARRRPRPEARVPGVPGSRARARARGCEHGRDCALHTGHQRARTDRGRFLDVEQRKRDRGEGSRRRGSAAMKLRTWYQSLAEREQRMVLWGGCAAAVLLLAGLIWELGTSVKVAEDRVARRREDLAFIEAATPRIQTMPAARPGESLTIAVDRM